MKIANFLREEKFPKSLCLQKKKDIPFQVKAVSKFSDLEFTLKTWAFHSIMFAKVQDTSFL